MLRVKKGYTVFCNGLGITEGGVIPPQFYDIVIKDQSWKVEEFSDKKDEIGDIAVNRMIKSKEVKKK